MANMAPAPGNLRLAVLNDLHHGSPECDPWFARLVEQVAALDPDACVLAGDLADTGLESSLVAVREAFARLECPVFPVPGNHDCDVSGDTSIYERVFPERSNYHLELNGWELLFLDTTEGAEWKDITISKKTLDWLARTAGELDGAKPTLVFSHFPLAAPIHMVPVNTDEVWKRLDGASVRGAFCGHFHGQHAVVRPPLVTTNVCCSRIKGNFDGDPRKGFWLVEADGTGRLDYRLERIKA